MEGFERTGYQRELELSRDGILNNIQSVSNIEQSKEVYRAIEAAKAKSKMSF